MVVRRRRRLGLFLPADACKGDSLVGLIVVVDFVVAVVVVVIFVVVVVAPNDGAKPCTGKLDATIEARANDTIIDSRNVILWMQ